MSTHLLLSLAFAYFSNEAFAPRVMAEFLSKDRQLNFVLPGFVGLICEARNIS